MMTLRFPHGCGAMFWLGTFAACLFLGSVRLPAQEAEWIWSPEHAKDAIPLSTCHFRKVFQLQQPQEGKLTVAADDQFEIRINGRLIGNGSGYRKLLEFDISQFLTRGRNIIAIKASNTRGSINASMWRLPAQTCAWLSLTQSCAST